MKKAIQKWRIMRLTLHALTAAFVLLSAGIRPATAQVSVPCPQNIDFSFGNFNNWQCFTGECIGALAPGMTPASSVVPWALTNVALSGPVFNRHTLTTGTGVSPFGGFPVVAPGGGLFSVQIGNDGTGAEAEFIRYHIRIPAGFNNYSFNYRYAVEFEDPGHYFYEQPRFTVTGYDSATGNRIECASHTYVAGAGLPGFQQSTTQSSQGLYPWYLPWTLGNLNLSGMGGRTVIVEVMSSDCTLGGHFGYGYFDVISCGQFNAAVTYCDLAKGIITLQGPFGYQKYEWFNQNFTTRLNASPYNHQTINVPAPSTPQYYNLVLTPYNSNGCPDTIKTRVIADFGLNATPDSVCNTLGKPIQLNVTTTGGLGGFKYRWTGDTTLSCDTCINPIAYPTSSGYYTITVTDSNGCFRQDTVKIENPGFIANLGPDLTTCLGTPLNLNPTVTPANAPGYIFRWIPATGISDSTVLKPVFTPFATGTHQFVLRVDSGICATSDTLNITTLPNTFFTTDTAVCESESITPKVQGHSAFKYTWTYSGPPPGFGQPPVLGFPAPAPGSDQKPTFIADTTRIFTITARYAGCPDIVRQLTVRVEPVPVIDLGADTLFKCMYQPVSLTVKAGPDWFSNYSYTWQPNAFIDKPASQIIRFTGDADTILLVNVSTPLGCASRDSVRVHVFPGNFGSVSPIDPEMCPRESVKLVATGGVEYRWDPPLYLSGANEAEVRSTPVTTTEYKVYITDKNGCVDTLSTKVTVHPEAFVSLPDSVILYPGESYQLNPSGNLLYYSWFPLVGLMPNASISNPVVNPLVNTRYYVTGTTEAGCKTTDSVYVMVREESMIDVANAFAPGSESNPVFKVLRLGNATLKYFHIYNRWGQKVFESTDINKGWDGTYNGTPQPIGVYVYTVEAAYNTGKPFIKQGNVTLIR